MVVCCNGNIYFNDLEELLTGEKKKKQLDQLDLNEIKFEDFEIDMLGDQNIFKFKRVNIKKNFNETTTGAGMRIKSVNLNDLDIAERNEHRDNVI